MLLAFGRQSRRWLSSTAAKALALTETPAAGVHGSYPAKNVNPRMWRDKPLLKFGGVEHYFRTGTEAVKILVTEARRRDGDKTMFCEQFEALMTSLTPVFDRAPRYAWLAKAFLEPERAIEFRVSFLDDSGSVRTHRGYRIQYSSTLGPYEGPLHFSESITADNLKSMALAANFSHALGPARLGGAAGGANFDMSRASDAEIQRFCQAFMSELAKYVGPNTDLPSTGLAVGPAEIGYLYGHYKRTANAYASHGRGLLWGGTVPHTEAYGYGCVHFASHVLADRKSDSLKNKRCVITGSGKIALAVAERLLACGAIPISLSDSSGFVYEAAGFDQNKFNKLSQIKRERGTRVGRYILASTTAKYFDPSTDMFGPDSPLFQDGGVDVVFLAAQSYQVDHARAATLADAGCRLIVDASHAPCTPAAIRAFKKLGVAYAPFKATLATGATIGASAVDDTSCADLVKVVDDLSAAVYNDVSATANEYNLRGDLNAGTNIASFLRLANVMDAHGGV